MLVVSNTSPIINLAAIGHLSLLEQLYGKIIIPKAVWEEIRTGEGQPGEAEVKSLPWFEQRQVSNRDLIREILNPGEAEALALAIELRADLLLIDERAGRMEAELRGLRFKGLLGVLIEAKKKGYLKDVKPLLDDLRRKRFWIGETLYQQVLKTVEE
jgi:predicted nucleic acid-binding protein